MEVEGTGCCVPKGCLESKTPVERDDRAYGGD
jgi:hypothetical protein